MKIDLKMGARKHFLALVFAVLIIAGGIFQGIYDWHLHKQATDNVFIGQPITATLIDNAINNLETAAPVDAKTGAIYFPTANLTLPAPSDLTLSKVEYVYDSTSTKSQPFLSVTLAGILSQSENGLLTAQSLAQSKNGSPSQVLNAIFKQVPSLQACSRGVQLFNQFQPTNGSDYHFQFSKALNNGSTIYAYTETQCSAQQLPTLVDYLKQIQSY